jgi:hypothetical protein
MRRAARTLPLLLAVAWLGGCSSPTESSPDFDVTFTAVPDPASVASPAVAGAVL